MRASGIAACLAMAANAIEKPTRSRYMVKVARKQARMTWVQHRHQLRQERMLGSRACVGGHSWLGGLRF